MLAESRGYWAEPSNPTFGCGPASHAGAVIGALPGPEPRCLDSPVTEVRA
jgi:hypothetical protein